VIMEIGVLALQGDFAKHEEMLTRLGAPWREVRTPGDLEKVSGLIIPGGESTTMLRVMRDEGLFEPLQKFVRTHPTFGTCAGVILMARDVRNPTQDSLQLMDLTVERNGYGRQVDSFTTPAAIPALGTEPTEMVFIRAPIITATGPAVTVMARCEERPVLVRQGHWLGATFHPELTADTRVHQLFLSMVKQAAIAA
jgi:pyridoxal 5'-phosphate synthase pdxT subunit